MPSDIEWLQERLEKKLVKVVGRVVGRDACPTKSLVDVLAHGSGG